MKRKMHHIYKVGGHCFKVSGSSLCSVLERMTGFAPFEVAEGDGHVPEFFVMEGKSGNIPDFCERQYVFAHEGVEGIFGCTSDGYLLRLSPVKEKSLFLWTDNEVNVCYLCGNWSARLVRFALWIGYGIQTAMSDTVAIHSSCIVYRQKAMLFFGESGTGKSTHARLWQEHQAGAVLLNDDSPVVRLEQDKIWVYGSPWSGKTPCYRAERYELGGCVRLSQAPFNQIIELGILQSYAAIHPSSPPEFAYDAGLYEGISATLGKIVAQTPFYHLACLPDRGAVDLSCRTLFGGGDEADSE